MLVLYDFERNTWKQHSWQLTWLRLHINGKEENTEGEDKKRFVRHLSSPLLEIWQKLVLWCWSVSCLPATVAIVASATKVQPIWFTEQGFPNSYTHQLLRLKVDLSNMFKWNICPSSWNSVLSMYWIIRFVPDHISEALCLGCGKLRTSDDHFEDKKTAKSLLSLLSLLQLSMLTAKI